jgi:chitin disaccharide deacetylase
MVARPERILIVNADDFGQSAGITQGILRAHRDGIVTSTSMMVRYPNAAEAAGAVRECPTLSVGLHFDIGEWVFRDGEWHAIYEVVTQDDEPGVRREFGNQLDRFRKLMKREPTHIDSHQHVHLREPARSILQEASKHLGVPLRHFDARIRYRGDFYGQTTEGVPLPDTISVNALIQVLLSMQDDCSELACHPSALTDTDTMYSAERLAELETLCDPRVRDCIDSAEIQLRSFAEIT